MLRMSVSDFTLTFLFILIATSCSTVSGLKAYQSRIPNGNSVPSPCGNTVWAGVGHMDPGGGPGSPINPFGFDFSAMGHAWTEALCHRDSDGDGRTNGAELGDPNCVWHVGEKPQFPASTHPGFCDTCPGACH